MVVCPYEILKENIFPNEKGNRSIIYSRYFQAVAPEWYEIVVKSSIFIRSVILISHSALES